MPTSVFLPPPGGPESGFLESKCTGLTCKNVIPTEGRKHFLKENGKQYGTGWKKGPKRGQLAHVMQMLGALARPCVPNPFLLEDSH